MDNGLKKIQITENQYKTLLNEMLSSVLYHFTTLGGMHEIAKTGSIYLNTSYRGLNDNKHKNKKFWFSFTRQYSSKFGYSKDKNVRIEFDGDLLNQRFEGKPIDYWGETMGKQNYFKNPYEYQPNKKIIDYTQSNTESEDRLFSNEPKIDNVYKYIKRIDILIDNSYEEYEKAFQYVKNNFQGDIDEKMKIRIENYLKHSDVQRCLYWLNDEVEKRKNQFIIAKDILMSRYFYGKVFVFNDEKFFNLKSDKTINDEIINNLYFDIRGAKINNRFTYDPSSSLKQIIEFFLVIDNIPSEKWSETAAKLLRHYKLEKYISTVIKKLQYSSYLLDLKVSTPIRDIFENDKNVYVYAAKMIDDFFKSHNFKDENEAKESVGIRY